MYSTTVCHSSSSCPDRIHHLHLSREKSLKSHIGNSSHKLLHGRCSDKTFINFISHNLITSEDNTAKNNINSIVINGTVYGGIIRIITAIDDDFDDFIDNNIDGGLQLGGAKLTPCIYAALTASCDV